MSKIQLNDQVIANVADVEDMVGTVTRVYTENKVTMVEVTYDEPVFNDENTLDVSASDVSRA